MIKFISLTHVKHNALIDSIYPVSLYGSKIIKIALTVELLLSRKLLKHLLYYIYDVTKY